MVLGQFEDFENLSDLLRSLGNMGLAGLETVARFLTQMFGDYPLVGVGLIAVLLAVLFLLPR